MVGKNVFLTNNFFYSMAPARFGLLLGLLSITIVSSWWLLRGSQERPAPETRSSTRAAFSDPVTASPASPVAAVSSDFSSRLESVRTITDTTQRRLTRAAILAEWLTTDFPAAFAFLRSEKFASLSLPGIAPLIAARVDLDQLVIIADESALTFDALNAIGTSLDVAKLNAFIATTGSVAPAKQGDVAAAIAATLTSRNLDAALRYAQAISEPTTQAAAYAAIVDVLTTKNATTDARALVESLPESVRNRDAVRWAYGNALRDSAPDEALASLGTIADPLNRRMALVGFSRDVEARAPAAAMQAIFNAGLTPEGALDHASRILRTWASLDPTAARQYLATSEWLTEAQRQHLLAEIRPTLSP